MDTVDRAEKIDEMILFRAWREIGGLAPVRLLIGIDMAVFGGMALYGCDYAFAGAGG